MSSGDSLSVPAASEYGELFGERVVNGRRVVVEKIITELAREFIPLIDEVLKRRREWIDSKLAVREKGSFPSWEEKFTDADGNTRTFKEIVQGLIDNFLGRDTPLRWRLNDNIPTPPDAHPTRNAGLEITGPWHPLSRAIHQINADVAVAFEDEEDASPAWYIPYGSGVKFPPVWEARRNVKNVLKGDIPTPYYEKGREYRVLKPRERWPTVFHRIPGLHLLDYNVKLDGKPIPQIITSVVIYVLNNFESLSKAGSGVYFYVPKVQTPDEALVVEKLLRRVEEKLGLRYGSIKIAMLYEEGMAGLYLPVILWIWRERLIKSSNGRWDYLGSLIEMWKDEAVFPDPQTITMTSPIMMVYQRYNALLMTMAGLKDGEPNAAPVGGMAAVMLYPQTDPYKRHRYNYKALRDIKLDKLRERLIGLIFIPDENTAEKVTLDAILTGRVKGRLFDVFRQSWVATKEESYVAAGSEPLRAELHELQRMIEAEVKYTEVDGKQLPTVDSGLTPEERKRFRNLGLINDEGKITPWIIPRSLLNSPENLFSPELWDGKTLWQGLYEPPKGDVTIEHIQHAFYMAANYGFQILNGNLAAAIDDYELNQRFMNDLATYRIFVSWLWTLIKHEATITKDGYLKAPELTENGVIPAKNAVEVKAGTRFTKELFHKLWELHYEWTRAFYAEYDRLAATRIINQTAPAKANDPELVSKVAETLSKAYNSGPFREQSPEETSNRIAELLNVDDEAVRRLVEENAPRFDRSKAPVIMDTLYKQLTSERYLQHSARLLFAIAEADEKRREQILKAVFSESREEVIKKIQAGELPEEMLHIHDYVYDYR